MLYSEMGLKEKEVTVSIMGSARIETSSSGGSWKEPSSEHLSCLTVRLPSDFRSLD